MPKQISFKEKRFHKKIQENNFTQNIFFCFFNVLLKKLIICSINIIIALKLYVYYSDLARLEGRLLGRVY